MGRGKRKSKFHSKSLTDNRSSNLSARTGRDVVPDGPDTADFENSENFSSNPLLSNHINDIKNINERVLVWNDDDIVDEKGNQVLHQLVSSQVIKTSMENSPFSKYLKSHLTDINKTSPAGLSGAIMKNYRKTPPSKHHEFGKFNDAEQIKKPLEILNMIELDVSSDNIESSEEISPKKTDVISTPLRRSGRSVKVNYLEMLRDSIFDTRRVSDTDSVSPTRRSKTSKTAVKSPRADPDDGDSKNLRENAGLLGDESGEPAEFAPDNTTGDIALSVPDKTIEPIDTGQNEEEINPELLGSADLANQLATDMSSQMGPTDGDSLTKPKGRRGVKRKVPVPSPDCNRQVEKTTKCTVCTRKVFCTRLFKNLCARCTKDTTSLLDCMQGQDDFVCIAEPACWTVSPPLDAQMRCSACAIQTLIEHHLVWGTALQRFSGLTLEALRHPDTVARVRRDTEIKASQTLELLERLGVASKTSEPITKSRSIVLPDSCEDGTPCRWDAATFSSRPVTTENALCVLCRDRDAGPLLSVLPACTVGVCHSCLSSASRDYRMALVTSTETDPPQIQLERPCEPICCGPAVRQCARCLLGGLSDVLPDLAAVRYRYQVAMTDSLTCQLCVRRQRSQALLLPLATGLPPQNRHQYQPKICIPCVCRIKIAGLGERASAEHRHGPDVTHVDCGQCLVEIAPHVFGSLRNFVGIGLQYHRESVTSVAASINYSGAGRHGPRHPAAAVPRQPPDETTGEIGPSVTKKQRTSRNWLDWLENQFTTHRSSGNLSDGCPGDGRSAGIQTKLPSLDCGNERKESVADAARAEPDGLGARRRRTVKPSHYNDYVVDNSWFVLGPTQKKSAASTRIDRHRSTKTMKRGRHRHSSHQSSSQRSRVPRQSSAGPLTDSAASQDDLDIERPADNSAETPSIPSPELPPTKASFRRIKQAQADRSLPLPRSASHDSEDEYPHDLARTEDVLTPPSSTSGAVTRPSAGNGPRVKQVSRQSVTSTDLNLDLAMLSSSLVPGQSAVGSGRQYSCVVKRANRTSKLPSDTVTRDRIKSHRQVDLGDTLDNDSSSNNDDDGEGDDNIIGADDDPEYKPRGVATTSSAASLDIRRSDVLEMQSRCGKCSSCQRFRCCGKCPPCLRNKSQRRKTETCLKMQCLAVPQTPASTASNKCATPLQSRLSDEPVSKGLAVATSTPIATIQQQIHEMTATETEKSADEIIPPVVSLATGTPLGCAVPETFRDSDSSDTLTSEDEQLDPELDRIHIVRGDGSADMGTVAVSGSGVGCGNAMGGFAVVSSVRARANKVLCFSCGSGGDHMIHCVSCAEPFHFFCIEFQFRPKSRKLFVCRNCTRCHACRGYGSELKCIKCQLGFHPGCVDRYPPARSDDKSDWACYKCAMCLHCGAKAEEAMEQHQLQLQNHRHDNNRHASAAASAHGPIDWSKDPWQCGRCARARHSGHVCPECGRAYQTGLETVECGSCARMVHRQCAGLTEDEYEVLKSDQVPGDVQGSFKCSKCVATDHTESTGTAAVSESEDESTARRVHQVKRRQCRDDSGLKRYCERGVMHRMAEFIGRAGAREEHLLDEQQAAAVQAEHDVDRLGQLDGVDEVEEEPDCETESSPLAERTACSTLCNSSESLGDYDVEHLIVGLDLPPESGPPPVATAAADIEIDTADTAVAPEPPKFGIFSRMSATDYLSPKHLLMDAVARIIVKRSRYTRQSRLGALYDELLDFLHEASLSLFPWLDFSAAHGQARETARRHAGRLKLVSAAIADGVRDCRGREFEVFASSIAEIEDKLQSSFRKGREDYIVFHSEQHLAALSRHMETCDPGQPEMFTKYRLAFIDTSGTGSNTICERDVRQCALCGYAGDDGLEGRLIYGGLDVWVHVNCALWSDEVFEREDGALVGVEAAIRGGETSICAACNNFGATVRCSARLVPRDRAPRGSKGPACPNVYHFGCAFRLPDEPVFTDSRTFFCSSDEHDSRQWQNEQQLGLADMLILRRIYLPQGSLSATSAACPNGLVSNDVVVSIGNLRIDCLGRIEPCSDSHRMLLCPVAFQARRLYWSMDEVDTLVMYFMSTRADPDKQPSRARPDSAVAAASGTAALSGIPSVAAPFARRRRMIETVDSRCMKRAKPMQCREDIVYEMDDDGNLQPITDSTDRPTSSSHKLLAIQDYHETTFPSRRMPPLTFNDHKKENRRFPIKNRVVVEKAPPNKDLRRHRVEASGLGTGTSIDREVEIIESQSVTQTVCESQNRRHNSCSGSDTFNPTHHQPHRQQSQCQLVPVLQHQQSFPTAAPQQSQWLPFSQHNQPHQIPVRRQLSSHMPRCVYIGTSRPSVSTVSLSTTSLSSVSLFHGNGRQVATTSDQITNISIGAVPASTQAKALTLFNKPIGSPVCTEGNIVGSSGLPRVVSVTGNNFIESPGHKAAASRAFPATVGAASSRYLSQKPGPRVIKLVKLRSSASYSSNRKLFGNNRAAPCLRVPLDSKRASGSTTLRIANVHGSDVASTPSVLRTVLTDGALQQQQRQLLSKRQMSAVDSSSPYVISSCGSLTSSNRIPPLVPAQYDGVAEDWMPNSFDGAISQGGAKSSLSSVNCAGPVETATGGDSPLDVFCLRFAIEGFKASKSPKSTWTYLVRRVAQLRESQGMSEYSLRTADGWAKFGLDHRQVVYLVEQLVGAFLCRNYEFKFHKARVQQLRQQHSPQVVPNHGCSRFEPWTRVRLEHVVRDPLAFLHSKANGPPKNHAPSAETGNRRSGNVEEDPAPDDDYLEKLATQFRCLHSGVHARENNVRVCCSVIHGRGLFARRGFEAHDIIIEYVGEVIRSILSDVRETEYQRTGIDCYMFRLDQDHIVDATVKGNAARFINHSCHPNCYAKVVRFEGSKHIIIIAQRTIYKGEELTYDYRFPIEDDKLPCTCGSFSCRKYLN